MSSNEIRIRLDELFENLNIFFGQCLFVHVECQLRYLLFFVFGSSINLTVQDIIRDTCCPCLFVCLSDFFAGTSLTIRNQVEPNAFLTLEGSP